MGSETNGTKGKTKLIWICRGSTNPENNQSLEAMEYFAHKNQRILPINLNMTYKIQARTSVVDALMAASIPM